jgi:ectoine hydroxylase-related dioxygenase (phytanoyl-CoA dioxygenase family)
VSDSRQRELDENGLAVVEGALCPAAVRRVTAAVDRLYDEEQAAGRLAGDGSLHLLGAVARDEAFLELLDLPTTFPLVCDVLGWNIHMYHSHVDVHPPVDGGGPEPWRWHQDGGRQNLELETDPRPRLSVKVAFFLSGVSEPDRGNLLVLPGSHRRNRLPGRELGLRPTGAVPVLAEPGTAVVFDRRLWHARSDNRSPVTRKVIFLGYTYRWIRPRDDAVVPLAARVRCSPVRRQLLGEGTSPMGYWIPTRDDVPLRAALASS